MTVYPTFVNTTALIVYNLAIRIIEYCHIVVEVWKVIQRFPPSYHVSFNVLVVGLVMEYLYPSCNQVLRIIEILAGYCERLEYWFKFIPLCHESTTVLVVGHFSQLGYSSCKILADYCRNLSEAYNN